MQIYIAKSGRQTGPFSPEQVQSMLDSGAVSFEDLAWHNGFATWQPLRQVLGTISNYTTTDGSALLPLPLKDIPALSEPVTLPGEHASFFIRVGASLIDGAVASFALKFSPLFLLPLFIVTNFSQRSVNILVISLDMIIVWLYAAFMESSVKQATIGKLACGLQVTDMNGKRIGFARASGRHFGKLLSTLILGIGYLMCALTEKKQCLHDMMAGCFVLKK